MATSPPFTKVRRTATKQIDSTPLLVYGSDNASFVDSIWVCNKNDKNIFVNFTTLDERNNETNDFQLINSIVLTPYESKELLRGAIINMEPGDLMYGYTTYGGDTFDCHVSFRELLEVVE